MIHRFDVLFPEPETVEECQERQTMNLWTQVAGYVALLLFGCVLLSFVIEKAHDWHQANTARLDGNR